MKASKYNHIYVKNGTYILYNCRTEDIVLMTHEVYTLWSQYGATCLPTLKDKHPEFYAHLKERGFIVDLECDEFEQIAQSYFTDKTLHES